MIPDKITDHVEAALDRKIEHFSGTKPVLDGVATAIIDQIQDLEDATWDVIYKRLLDPAPGQTEGARGLQLDIIGKIVGCKRQGYTDDQYVLAIKLQILINKSQGKTEDVLKIVRAAIGPSGVITERNEQYHHFAYYRLDAITADLAVVLYLSMQRSRAGGYRAVLEYYTTRVSAADLLLTAWTDADDNALSSSGANGFAWTDADGNVLAGVGFTTAMQG